MELAILSPDNFPLLDKMRKELIEVGYKDDKGWNDRIEKWREERPEDGEIKRLDVIDGVLRIYRISFCLIEQVTLTASNYNEILTRCKEAINTMK